MSGPRGTVGSMTRDTAVVRWCTTCAADVAFGQPDCLDGHEGDCPDWACLECGEAWITGFALADPADLTGLTRHVA